MNVAITSSSLRKEKKEITNQQWMRVQMSLLYLNSGATVFYYLKKKFFYEFFTNSGIDKRKQRKFTNLGKMLML